MIWLPVKFFLTVRRLSIIIIIVRWLTNYKPKNNGRGE